MSAGVTESLPIGTVVHKRYRITAVVGHGGLGTVYQIADVLYGKQNVFALKELVDQSPGARKQFELESQWLQSVDHNNIPKVREHFEWAQRLYLVMDFVDGENLEQKLGRAGGRPLPEQQVLAWTLPICDALHYLHTRLPAILHRDVKPANIIVTPAGHPVLVDLGIAKAHLPGANQTLTFVRKAGTEGYAPPEQYSTAGQTGPWSDVYGLGATLYHLLTGRLPPTAVDRVTQGLWELHPRGVNLAVSPHVDAAITCALALRPAERFPTMVDFARALAQAGPAAAQPRTTAVPPASPWPVAHPSTPALGQPTAGLLPLADPRSPAPMSPPPGAATPLPTGGSQPLAIPPHRSGSTGRMPAIAPASARVTGRRLQTGADLGAAIGTPAASPEPVESGPSIRKRILLSAAAVCLVLGAAALGLSILRNVGPPDRSSPSASVNGYFAALIAQDYNRAWQYSTGSRNNTGSQATFTASLRADDAHYGRVLSAQITQVDDAVSGSVTVVATVTRAAAPQDALTYTLILTQYDGNTWLINSISTS
jgi:serine/threonine protein kinase